MLKPLKLVKVTLKIKTGDLNKQPEGWIWPANGKKKSYVKIKLTLISNIKTCLLILKTYVYFIV